MARYRIRFFIRSRIGDSVFVDDEWVQAPDAQSAVNRLRAIHSNCADFSIDEVWREHTYYEEILDWE